jgi:small subunit ribosomal protein S13
MPRISGVNISEKKCLFIALTEIYGIGISRSVQICKAVALDTHIKVSALSEEQVQSIRDYIAANFTVDTDLRKLVRNNIKRLTAIQCYRGIRHKQKLPLRGQRTHTNAKTCKRVSG